MDSMLPFIKGSLLALTMCLNVGPGLVLQFKASLNRGFWSGAAVVAGLYFTNITILTVSSLGLGRFLNLENNMKAAGLIGGVLLIIFGTVMLVRHVRSPESYTNGNGSYRTGDRWFFMLKGMGMNISNPFNVIFWLGMVGLASSQFGAGSSAFLQFFTGLFVTAVTVDMLKCYMFSKAGHFLRESTLNKINHAMGILLMILGAGIIVRTLLQ